MSTGGPPQGARRRGAQRDGTPEALPVKPLRWQGSDEAIRAVQVAFDVEETVMEALRTAAFDGRVSMSDQIRQVLGLSTTSAPKQRPRLTVSLNASDYEFLARRYGLAADDRLAIKEKAALDLIAFAKRKVRKPAKTPAAAKPGRL